MAGLNVSDLDLTAENRRPFPCESFSAEAIDYPGQKKLGSYIAPDFGAPETFGTKPNPALGVTEWFDAKADVFAVG